MRTATRGSLLAIVVTLFLGAPGARAADGGGIDAFYVRVGGLSEGPQHTFKHGLELGAGGEISATRWLVLGLGVGLARQRNQLGYDRYAATAFSLELHGRWLMGDARVRPMLEMGAGYYHLDLDVLREGGYGFGRSWRAPGMWFGTGAQVRITPSVSVRPGIAYHVMAPSITMEGGNLEDYFAIGASLAYHLPGR